MEAVTSSTPMLKQYQSIKSKHKDCILFFRLGDFYEMFYEDAQIASGILDLVLTSRGKDPSGKIPMCGVPYHAADNYIARLIKAGRKVAICEQMESPSQGKGIVRRDVTRIISSGTYLDDSAVDSRYLLCFFPNKGANGIAFMDPATGTIKTNQYNQTYKITELISKLPVYECIYPESKEDDIKEIFSHPLLKIKDIMLSPLEDWCFNPDIAQKSLCEHFGTHNLNGFGIDGLPSAVSSSSALLEYLKRMNKQPLRHIDRISMYTDNNYVFISPPAYQGLEIQSLLNTIDYSLTPLGKRQLHYWVTHPLKNTGLIQQRQDAVTQLSENKKTQENIKIQFSHFPDIEKSISRLSCGYLHAKDILSIRNTLSRLPLIRAALEPIKKSNTLFSVEDIPDLRRHLENAVNPDIPLSKPEGKVIREGYNAELDGLRKIQETGNRWLKDFQAREAERAGINSLKVGYNKVFGYYIEITKTHASRIPPDYIRKQTLVNAERYITQELKDYEEKILTAQDKILKIENEILAEIRKRILDRSEELHSFCQSIAVIDCLYSLNVLAQSQGYIAPEVSNDAVIDIKDGRHPVVEKTSPEDFVPNDTLLDCESNHFIILTGPNMAGKSTYIRQIANLVILAQIGSYIPAKSAHIGIVDKIFTRIGAHDDISKGQSTFMVEMNEAADILNNMTDRSLIILDEIGRGTSTFDGLSLAWAIAEYLQSTKARTLFATHYHELTTLADEHAGVRNYNVAVKEWKDDIIFLHKIIPGSTDDSYGIYVAKLAGIPKTVIDRSKQILTKLELNSNLKEHVTGRSKEEQMSLFSSPPDTIDENIKAEIESIDINGLTPIEAMNKLVNLKNKISSE